MIVFLNLVNELFISVLFSSRLYFKKEWICRSFWARALMVENDSSDGFHMTKLKRYPRSSFLRQESGVGCKRRSRCLCSTLRVSRCTWLFIRSVSSVLSFSSSHVYGSLFSSRSLSHFPSGVLLRKALSYLRQRTVLACLFPPDGALERQL